MKEFLKFLANVFSAAFLFVGLMAFFAVCYTNHVWGRVYVEQMMVAALNDFDTIGSNILWKYISFVFIPASFMTFILFWKINKKIWLNTVAFCMMCYALWSIKLIEYISNQSVYSQLYEEEYINPKDLKFDFPYQKRNLIMLYLESMEEDYKNADLVGENLLPKLSLYQNQGLHFPNFLQMPMQDYTMAAIVSSMCGVPYRLQKGIKPYKIKDFLPNLTCFPQILEQNDYENYILKSTDLDFVSARRFYTLHGFKHIKDKPNLEKEIDLEKNSGTSWGYNDRTYYGLAKKELTKIAATKNPFMFVLITLDTHGPDIYLDKQCEKIYNDKRDIIKCADSMASEFLSWLQNQDFYKDTTVVVVGDHPETYGNDLFPNQQNRKIVNFILNPAETFTPQEHEVWSTIDLAPTILNALGIEFGHGEFGLGRSLLQDTPTLYEKYHNQLSNDVLKSSHLYDTFYNNLQTAKE